MVLFCFGLTGETRVRESSEEVASPNDCRSCTQLKKEISDLKVILQTA